MSKIRFFEGVSKSEPRFATRFLGFPRFNPANLINLMKILVLTVGVSFTATAQIRDSVTVKNEIDQLKTEIDQLKQDTGNIATNIQKLVADTIPFLQNKIETMMLDSADMVPEMRYGPDGGPMTKFDKAVRSPPSISLAYFRIFDIFWTQRGSTPDIIDTAKTHIPTSDSIRKALLDEELYIHINELKDLHDFCEQFIKLCTQDLPGKRKKVSEAGIRVGFLQSELVLKITKLEDKEKLLKEKEDELEEIRKNAGVGIEQLTIDNGQLKIYPNPAGNQLQITNYELRENAYIEIYSVVGQLVQTSPNPSKRGEHTTPNFFEGEKAPSPLERAGGEVVIDISHLPNGIYFLKINNQVTKFVKE